MYYYYHIRKVNIPVNILLPLPLTAKCTAHKCSASVLYVYLTILLFKEKPAENYCKREGWTDDASSKLHRDILFFYFLC